MSRAKIYKIINLTNGKFYIGSTIKVESRFKTHKRLLNANRHHCTYLQNAWNKDGPDNFVFKVIQEVTDETTLHEVEQKYLFQHHGKDHCYNMALYTDNSNRGVVRPPSHKEAISKSLKSFYKLNGPPNLGRKHKEESKQLMSQNRAGKPVSAETKQKLREANIGKKYSEATKQKLSQMRKGKVRTESHAAKFNKQIIEVTSGIIYPSLKAVKEAFNMSPGMLAKALAADRPLVRGKNTGKHFRYVVN